MTFSEKRFLRLPKPTKEDFRGDRERMLDALKPMNASMTLEAMRSLYPLVSQADYAVTVTLCPGNTGMEVICVEPGDTTQRLYGLALDIGSTTLEMELVDMNTQRVLRNVGCVNSQVSFGLNILDRILAVKENRENLEALRALVVGDINRLIAQATEGLAAPEEISALIVGGNTTMIHFFLGCDPWLVFQNPYAPVFFDPGIQSAGPLGLNLRCNVFCFPAKANYLGGDITAGLLLTDLDTAEKPSIFGTGIFDLVAQCYLWGWIRGDGTVDFDRAGENAIQVWEEKALRSEPAIVYYRQGEKTLYFTQADIQEFVRCKAAAHTMVATLLDYCGLSLEDIGNVYLAGGFGTHINLESAITVGIYPDIDRNKLKILGNTSLAGAKKLLLDAGCIDRVRFFLETGEYLHFAEMDMFLENMMAANFIPHTNAALYPSVKRKIHG